MRNVSINLGVTLYVLVVGAALADPKAYELVKYRGHADRVAIAFDFADGYPEASEIRVTEHGKRTIFRLDDADSTRFVPANDKKNNQHDKRELVLKMSLDNAAPDKVSGTYTDHVKTLSFTLIRQ